ncbi:SPFH domain-containing protein, partial [Bacillus sp. SS-TM]
MVALTLTIIFALIVDRVRVYHDLRIQQTNVPPQKVITKDNVQVEIDTIIFYQIVEPELATYGCRKRISKEYSSIV